MVAHERLSEREGEVLPLLVVAEPVDKEHGGVVASELKPHALLGFTCVALSAVCFSVMSTLIKYATYSMTSMEAAFWRSAGALVLNYTCIVHQGMRRDSRDILQTSAGLLALHISFSKKYFRRYIRCGHFLL